MSRRCEVCGRQMPEGSRHLHELDPGEAFRLPLTGRVSRLYTVAPGRCVIEDPSDPETVEFDTFDGNHVEFQRPASVSRPCSPYAQVRLL